MNVLLDECLPRKLKYELSEHTVWTVPEKGWGGTKNGALLRLAEATFEVFITSDQNLEYQQNLSDSSLAIIQLVAASNRLETLLLLMPAVREALETIQPGEMIQIGPNE
jgi:hypothetical protein